MTNSTSSVAMSSKAIISGKSWRISPFIFFIGILLAVASLAHSHILTSVAQWLDQSVDRLNVAVTLIGLVSAIVDNVPLVAASMGMHSLARHPPDSFLWECMACCADTGGLITIICAAADVAAMGLEKIDFIWHAKRSPG
ncbi:MAG TPA: hypothetical protein PLB25_02780 [Rhodoferax sp.]|nr:hypothetical protein [Rhodoferax sp.]